jgi:hypothetical protein
MTIASTRMCIMHHSCTGFADSLDFYARLLGFVTIYWD